ILRFNADGSLDTTFGGSGTGKVTTDFTATADADRPYAITIQPTNGDIVVVGEAGNQSTIEHFAVARYTAAGILDTSFDTGGEVVTPITPSTPDEAHAVAIDSSGRILVGGQSWTQPSGSTTVSALVRYNPNGTLDTGFGVGGIQTDLLPGFSSAMTIGLGF